MFYSVNKNLDREDKASGRAVSIQFAVRIYQFPLGRGDAPPTVNQPPCQYCANGLCHATEVAQNSPSSLPWYRPYLLPTIGGLRDPEGNALVRSALEADGVQFYLESKTEQVERVGGDKIITFQHNGATDTLAVDEILLVAGRRPNIEGLSLEAAGIEYTKKGLVVNDRLQTTNGDVFGAGDVAIPAQFTHTADATARIALQNAFFFGRKKYSDLIIPWTVYTDPEIAHVGLFDYEAEEQGTAVTTFTTHIQETD